MGIHPANLVPATPRLEDEFRRVIRQLLNDGVLGRRRTIPLVILPSGGGFCPRLEDYALTHSRRH
jgi:hypothetical protein